MTSSYSSPPRPEPGATAPLAGAPLQVATRREGGEHVLTVVGEADVSTADQLRGHLIGALAGQPRTVRVDLDGLEFCDLSGLDALHDAAQVAADRGVPLAFTGMRAQLAWLHCTYPRRPAPRRRDPAPGSTPAGAGLPAHTVTQQRGGPTGALSPVLPRAPLPTARLGEAQDAGTRSMRIAERPAQ